MDTRIRPAARVRDFSFLGATGNLLIVTAVVLLFYGTSAQGAERYWNTSVNCDGSFSDVDCWDTLPGVDDVANWNNGSASTYVVSFLGDFTNQRARIRNDDIFWDLNRHTYTLTDRNNTRNPGLSVGVSNGQTGVLEIFDGTLDTNGATIGINAGSTGTLTLTTGASLISSANFTMGAVAGATGSVILENGATANANSTAVGLSGTGFLDIGGAGSTLTVVNSLFVAANAGAQGQINIDNGGAIDVAGNAYIGGNAAGAGGSGTLNVNDGGSMVIGGALNIFDQGVVATGLSVTAFPGGHIDTGTLTVSGGGTLTSRTANIGDLTSNSANRIDVLNSATVTGVGSEWATQTFNVASAAGSTGSLDIADGGRVSATSFSYVGFDTNSQGTVTVDGAGSSWVANDAEIGFFGTGVVTVTGGGAVTGGAGLGWDTDGHGTITLAGAGSQWDTGGAYTLVGNYGTGIVDISDGGSIIAGGILGAQDTGRGAVTVDGYGSVWDGTHDLWVGGHGTGTLDITNGGRAFGGVGAGQAADGGSGLGTGHGTVNVDGGRLDGQVGASPDELSAIIGGGVEIGFGGTGILNISNGAQVSFDSGSVGVLVGSSGTVTIGGYFPEDFQYRARLKVDGFGGLKIGDSGTGVVNVTYGGELVGGSDLGAAADGHGTVNVDGGGWWDAGTVTVGGAGTGIVNLTTKRITDDGNNAFIGGVLTASGASLGNVVGSYGEVNVDSANQSVGEWSSEMDLSGDLTIGLEGMGVLNVLNGGEVSNADGVVGEFALGGGTVLVDGAGSSWTNAGELTVGADGTGSLTINGGGSVSNTNAYLGNALNASGTATIDGTGSQWTNTNSLYVGGNVGAAGGTGTLSVDNGGGVFVGNQLQVWNTGGVEIRGGTLTAALANVEGSFLATGGAANIIAQLTVASAGTVTVDGGSIDASNLQSLGKLDVLNGTLRVYGTAAASALNGQTTLTPAGRILADGGELQIATSMTNGGTLEATNDGTVNLTAGNTLANSITRATTGGTVRVETGADLEYGFVEAANAGSQIYVQAGGTIRNAIVQAFDDGNINVAGGGTIDGGSVRVFNGGTLTGSGDILADVYNTNGGGVGPGNSSGMLNIDGNYEQDENSLLLIELAGLTPGTEYDVLDITGTADLDGLLDVKLLGGFEYELGDTFDILMAETITGSFSGWSIQSANGLRLDILYLADEIGSTDVVRLVAAVPVPGAIWLLGSALALLGAWRRRAVRTNR